MSALGTWHALAQKNSKVYRKVYGYGIPDGEPPSYTIYLFSIF